ncbi:unnamed protein product [Blepharisma stoltei]|uniref:Uncharacterized protein n=1 Tax=Blepharisma stoltei TaxID=1481888 RepID=A0AAU9KH70_9CILI|nr:unnamed protein product [Blepharisma stoltei]
MDYRNKKYLCRDMKEKSFLIKTTSELMNKEQKLKLSFTRNIFQHKPISKKALDYMITHKIACDISAFQSNEDILLSYFNKVNISENIKLYSKYFQEFLTEKQLEKLYKVVLSSKQFPELQIAASNAITILNYSNYNFKNKSLNGIKVPKSDLSGCNFINVDLGDSDLSRCNLSNSYFYYSNLENCNLSKAQFGKLKSLKTVADYFDILFSPSGKYFACSTKVSIWETKTWKRILIIDGWMSKGIAFSPCEKYIAVGTEVSEVCIWNIERKRQVLVFTIDNLVDIAYSPCGNFLLAISDGKGCLVDLQTREPEYYSNNHIDFALFSKCGKIIIEVLNCEVWLYEIKNFNLIGKTRTGGSTRCSCLSDNILILGDSNGVLYVWNMKLDNKIAIKAHINAAITSISTDSTKGLAATSSFDRSIKLWDINTQTLVYQYHCSYFSKFIRCVLSSNLGLLAISHGSEILLHDYHSLIKAKPFIGTSSLVEYISVSHDEKIITSIDKNNETIEWDIEKDWKINRYTKKYEFWSNWTYRNRLKATTNYEKILLRKLRSRVTLFTISPCGRFFAYNYRGSIIYIFDIILGPSIQTINCEEYVTGFLLSHNGRYLLTAHRMKGLAILWDIKSGMKINETKLSPNWNVLVASECATIIAFSYDSDVSLIKTENSEYIERLKGLHDYVSTILFFPFSSRYLAATGQKDKRILVWDVETTGIILVLNGHLGEINYLTFYLNGNFLISASSDMTLKVWNIDAESDKDLIHWSSMSNEFSAYKTSFKNAALSKDNQNLIDSLSQTWDN